MPDDDHTTPPRTQTPRAQTRPLCEPTFRDLLAAAEAARRVSTPPPAAPRAAGTADAAPEDPDDVADDVTGVSGKDAA